MPWIVIAAVAAACSVSILTLVNMYLYSRYRERFMKLWAIAWGTHVFRYFFLVALVPWPDSLGLKIANYFCVIASAVILLSGTRIFIGKPPAQRFIATGALIALWTFVVLCLALPVMYAIVPIFAFLAFTYINIGLQVLRQAQPGEVASRIVGWLFVAWGAHQADYPFLRPIEWLAPWGFLTGSVLATAIATGMILIHFERTQSALQEQKERHTNLVELSDNWVWEIDTDGIYTYTSHHVEGILGYTMDEVLGKAPSDFVPQDEAVSARAAFAETRSRRASIVRQEKRVTRKDGSIAVLETSGAPYYDGRGSYLGYRGMDQDITERKLAEAALRTSEGLLRASQEISHLGSWSFDLATRRLVWSDEVYRIFGFKPQEFEPSFERFLESVHPDDRAQVAEGYDNSIREHRGDCEMQHRIVRHATGEVRTVRQNCTHYCDETGHIVRSHGMIHDISDLQRTEEERKRLEQQFQQTQKLESLGVLSGGIAHDFNNILSIIIGNCSLAKIDTGHTEKYLSGIENAADRAAALCRQMLAYAGKAQMTQTQFDLATLVDEMAQMLTSTLPPNARIGTDLAAGIPLVRGDASQLRQVVMNLIINASEAIGESQGEIRVALRRTVLLEGEQSDYNGKEVPAGKYICLEVTDTGCGMNEETRRRIFEPFYTTKFTGRGLGMSAVLGIVAAHLGALQLSSKPGEGTTFRIYLPGETARAEVRSEPVSASPWQGSGTILLVEDEDQIRLLASSMLSLLGFGVLEAENGQVALELLEKNTGIVLVLTDMGMPIMDGNALLRELKQRAPKLPVVVSSGFGDSAVASRLESGELAGLISKPYTLDQFRRVLQGVLESAAPEA